MGCVEQTLAPSVALLLSRILRIHGPARRVSRSELLRDPARFESPAISREDSLFFPCILLQPSFAAGFAHDGGN